MRTEPSKRSQAVSDAIRTFLINSYDTLQMSGQKSSAILAQTRNPPRREHLIKRVLGHSDGSFTAIYNRYGYVREMRAFLEQFASDLLTTDSSVTTFRNNPADSRHPAQSAASPEEEACLTARLFVSGSGQRRPLLDSRYEPSLHFLFDPGDRMRGNLDSHRETPLRLELVDLRLAEAGDVHDLGQPEHPNRAARNAIAR